MGPCEGSVGAGRVPREGPEGLALSLNTGRQPRACSACIAAAAKAIPCFAASCNLVKTASSNTYCGGDEDILWW